MPTLSLVLALAGPSRAADPPPAAAPPPAEATASPAATADAAPPPTRFAPVAAIGAQGQVSIVSPLRKANMRADAKELYWTPRGFERRVGSGVRVWAADDATWWRPGDLSPDARSLADLLAMSGGVGDWVESRPQGPTRMLVYANIAGQRERVGVLPGPPDSSIVLMVPPGGGPGKESRLLARNHGFQFDDEGKPLHVVPSGATALPLAPPDDALARTWTSDLAGLRGATPTITWATKLDLDRDGQDEGALCVTGGKDDQDCYVVDETAGTRRYYGLSTMRFEGGDAATAPLPFRHGDGVYIMHVPSGPQARPVILLARWDGSTYRTQSVK